MAKIYPKAHFLKHYLKSRSSNPVIVSVFISLLSLAFSGCSTLQESSKYQFSEGLYRVKLDNERTKEMYVDPQEEDSLVIYPVQKSEKGLVLDTLNRVVLNTSTERAEPLADHYTFARPSFDIDVLTIPIKYRSDTEGLPRQLTTSFQAALYTGLRTDYYRMGYTDTPLGKQKRHFNHFGFSMGLFAGLGSAFINEGFTNGTIAYEYDALVINGGIAAIIGVNNFTLGLCVGIDHLMDQNREEWIYQHKPWIGLGFGLNLN